MTVILCRYEGFYLRRLTDCPTCKGRRRMVQWCRVWDDPILTCCSCGDAWSSDGRMERPFERGWRKRAVARARENYAEAGGRTELRAWLETVKPSPWTEAQ